MFKKAKIYAALGFMLLGQFFGCITVFFVTYKEKRRFSAAIYATALALGAAGSALISYYTVKENQRVQRLKNKIAEKDHWFHSFEYPECHEPKIKIDETYIPPVETEEN